MTRLARTLALAITVSFVAPGCAAIATALPHVIAAVVDAVQILDAIEAFVAQYFAAQPDKEKELKVAKAIAKTRAALNVALRSVEGAEKLDQQKVDEAFTSFKQAYQELIAIVGPLGVKPAGALMATQDGGLQVPEPRAMRLQVK